MREADRQTNRQAHRFCEQGYQVERKTSGWAGGGGSEWGKGKGGERGGGL